MNGTPVLNANLDAYAARFGEYPGLTRKTGRIGLQLYDTRVEFRSVPLRELL